MVWARVTSRRAIANKRWPVRAPLHDRTGSQGLGLVTSLVPDHTSAALSLVPAVVALGAIVGTLALGRVGRSAAHALSGESHASWLLMTSSEASSANAEGKDRFAVR